MNKSYVLAFVLSILSTFVYSQTNEKKLADTVKFISDGIGELECLNYEQDTYRLNFDDCNLEYKRFFIDEEEKWLVYDFWLVDLDEEQMSMDFAEGGWRIVLVSPNKKIEYDSHNGSGWVSEMHIYGKDQASLIPIGRALYYAIKSCKGLDRFK